VGRERGYEKLVEVWKWSLYTPHLPLANFIIVPLGSWVQKSPLTIRSVLLIYKVLRDGTSGNLTCCIRTLLSKWRNRMRAGIVLLPMSSPNISHRGQGLLWLGIKIHPSERMGVCLLERDTAQGSWALNPPLASTGFIDTTVPSTASIVIPKRLLSHGVPIALIPPTLTPDYVLDLNIL
jgi:hypothetical protein